METNNRQFMKAERLQNVSYEVRGQLLEVALGMEAAGEKIIKLNIGNPACFGFTAPDDVLEKMRERAAVSQPYSEFRGNIDALQSIQMYAAQKGIQGVELTDIYTGNGASELIEIALEALLNTGDEVLVPSPDYPLWTAAVTLNGGKPVYYVCDEESDWSPDLQDIERKITPRTRAIVIINPNNPTGALYSKDVLKGIAEIARRHDLVIFSDEIYDRLLLDGDSHTSIASLAPDCLCVTMNGLSKSHMLCGFRIGWMVISGAKERAKDYIAGIDMLTNMRLCSNVPGQSVISTALSGFRAERFFVPGGRVCRQRDTVWKMLNNIPGVKAYKPKAAFYIFPGVDAEKFGIKDDDKFALDLLKATNVLIVPGKGFNWGKPGYFRIVYLPETSVLEDAVCRIGNFLEGYRQK